MNRLNKTEFMFVIALPPYQAQHSGTEPGFLERGFICIKFDLILYVPSTIFQLCRDGSSWVEPVLRKDNCVLHKDTTQ